MDESLARAGLALAAFERTVLANRAPIQNGLRGAECALNAAELRGGFLFFDYAGCAARATIDYGSVSLSVYTV